jgi:hypothetical protein
VTVRIDGIGEARTAADGTFSFSTTDPEQIRPVTLSSSATVERQTRLRVPGPSATLSLMPASLNLLAFNEMFRSGGVLRRWTAAPALVIQTRVLQFDTPAESEYKATAATLTDSEVSGLLTDLSWALPQLTGSAFAAFSDVRIETAAEGTTCPCSAWARSSSRATKG